MTKEEHILGIIKDSKDEEESKKRIREFLEPDYIPKNSMKYDCPMNTYGIKDIIDIQPALPGMRCARVTGEDDPQSGPFYCGEPGYIYGWSKNHPEVLYVMCENCAYEHRIQL